jgi:predicted HAD superfamily hydrolase
VIFKFDDEVSISVEGQFEYTSATTSSDWRPGNPLLAAPTLSLLSARIEGVHGQENGTLELRFSNEDHLLVKDTNKEYESYQISRRGETIVV